MNIELFPEEDRKGFDAAIESGVAIAQESIIEGQMTPRDDVERSLVTMALWRHRYGKEFNAQHCISSTYLSDCQQVAVQIGFCEFENFTELWRKPLPRSIDECRIIQALIKYMRVFGDDFGRYMFARIFRDKHELKLPASVIADRAEQGYIPQSR